MPSALIDRPTEQATTVTPIKAAQHRSLSGMVLPALSCDEKLECASQIEDQDCMSCTSSVVSTLDTWQDGLLGPHEGGVKDNFEFEMLCVDVKQDGLKCCTYMHSTQAGTGMTPEHRARTVDSMIAAAAALRLQNDSLFTAVACLDRYLSVVPTQATLLQPAGIACLWLAAKFEEVYNQQLLRGINFSRFMLGPGGNLLGEAPAALQLLVLLEERILTALDYRLASIVTVIACKHGIMQQLCSGSSCGATAKQQAGLMMSSPPAAGGLSKLQLDQLYCMTSYLTEISLLEYQLLTCRPAELAAAALAVAGLLLGLPGQDEQHLLFMTGYNMHELAVPMEWLCALHCTLHAAWQAGRPYAVTLKYCDSALHSVAAVPPITSTDDLRLLQ